jgi:DMSO/TMAO reductase YedYZ molybdopterin-dependent catalytic subunit
MTIFGAFTIVGAGAMVMQTMVDVALVLVAMGIAAGFGILALRRLIGAAGIELAPVSTTSTETEPRPMTDLDRRRFLAAAGSVAAAGALAGAGGRSLQRSLQVEIHEVTLPSASDTVPPVGPANDLSVPSLSPIITPITPNDDFYKIDTELGVPHIDPDDWTLTITGMVDNELTLTFEELLERPMMERYVTIACVSNEVGDDLVDNAKWLGTPLAELLNEAGVQAGASQIVGRAVGGWTCGFPTELAFDGRDAMVAVGMNGEPLPVDHGFPARLIIPGLYGYVSATKWLREIELTTWDGFYAYWVPRGWAKEGPIKTQSRIDVPHGRSVAAGSTDVAGVAWAPTRGIERVEVQVDEEDWREAVLSEPLSEDAWVQWRLQVELSPGSHRLRVRATDGTGETQTSEVVPPRPDGASGWHTIQVTAA